jgi:hypothetical protein
MYLYRPASDLAFVICGLLDSLSLVSSHAERAERVVIDRRYNRIEHCLERNPREIHVQVATNLWRVEPVCGVELDVRHGGLPLVT